MFIGRSDVEAETPILWSPDVKSWLIWRLPDAGQDWGQEEKGMTEGEMVGRHHRLNGYGFGLAPGVGDGPGGHAAVHGVTKSRTRLNWPELKTILYGQDYSYHPLKWPMLQLSRFSCLTLCDPMCRPICVTTWPHVTVARLLCSWDSLDKNTGVGCHALLQGIFLTQGSNPHLLGLLQLADKFFTT